MDADDPIIEPKDTFTFNVAMSPPTRGKPMPYDVDSTPPRRGSGDGIATVFAESYRKLCKVTGHKYPHTLAQSVKALRYTQSQLDAAVKEAVEKEREACAQIAHDEMIMLEGAWNQACEFIAELIEARALVSSEMSREKEQA